jgi:hypothetical protein
MAYGLDPKWASGANHDDPALAYAVEKTAINAAGVEMAAILSTWLT